MSEADAIRQILTHARTIAVVGLSPDPARPSYQVARSLQVRGYRIIPINPNASEILGEKAYPNLTEAAQDQVIEVVNCFRRSREIPPSSTKPSPSRPKPCGCNWASPTLQPPTRPRWPGCGWCKTSASRPSTQFYRPAALFSTHLGLLCLFGEREKLLNR